MQAAWKTLNGSRSSRTSNTGQFSTYDNAMPIEHREWLTDLSVTLAVVDSNKRPQGLTTEEYWRDVIHHHAHRFPHQEPGSWWKYRRRTRRRLN